MKEKGKVKSTNKKESKPSEDKLGTATAGVAACMAAAAGIAEALESERSLMSSPEDLTKDFEELKEHKAVPDEKKKDGDLPVIMCHDETASPKKSPEADEHAESLDEGITTTEPEGESGGTPDEPESKGKISGDANEKFEDEGTGLEESSEAGDYEEKGESDQDDEREYLVGRKGTQYSGSYGEGKGNGNEAPRSPVASVRNERLPAGAEKPTADDVSPSLHAEVGSPQSTEVDDSLSVSVVQTPTTFQETEMSPSRDECPRPMSISPDYSPKTAKSNTPQQEPRSPEQATMSVEFGQESPDHSLALDFSKQSPEHPALGGNFHVAENGPTEVDCSPPGTAGSAFSRGSVPMAEKPMLFKEADSTNAASVSPSDGSTPSVNTPSQTASPVKADPLVKATAPREMSPGASLLSESSQNIESLRYTKSSQIEYSSYQRLTEGTQRSAAVSGVPSDSKTCLSPQSRSNVDLCLVSSCEYRHPKTELSPSFINPNPLEYFANEANALEEERPLAKSGGRPPPSGGKQHMKQCEETPATSTSESAPSQTDSDVPPGTEECPSITADANIDSDDDSETLPTDRTITHRHVDPPPAPMRDSTPSPPRPDVCMVDPEAAPVTESLENTPKKEARAKKCNRVRQWYSSRGGSVPNCPPVYLDLVYIPNHCNAKNVDAEFFKCVRSSYYVVSGNDLAAEEPSRAVLDSLLEGKSKWGNNMQVTLIPTHDSEVMREWYQETHEKQQNLNITVLASSSTVVMQDECFPACKIEL
ncbi:hypothetical protein ANANG_G00198930 [Anguilla anguilla]|uniref:Microtubule-associated protein 1B n=1 Tax=Anguilla anguilla TaxID=7936 RepID=A0A9D3M5Z8_ANGAN|nr:hypothetical protein ANANG_G00198930 [Anguilla anguilla]